MEAVCFDTARFPRLDFRDPKSFREAVSGMQAFFREHDHELDVVREKALGYKGVFDLLDPFIQDYTAKVCPYCGTVCCANKHGFPEFADMVGFLAMGVELPVYKLDVDPRASCQFMGEKGCMLLRHRRPYRCTRYFCEALVVQIEIGPPRHYRRFVRDIEVLSAARGDLMSTFYEVWLEKGRDFSR